ncbi:predicted protein [Lichtheimia corymbifera JMRC:FSU:9682]|uniref:Uncharacterized protein n=1 Tax=Lichtheimia corymbifera JMRC:FSU:9682 TaxID=1263082 RepID=A0A068SFU3_9FUNG|nr:predicted protein [Lichtheimia corymbifera JMRC:FSU:9682]
MNNLQNNRLRGNLPFSGGVGGGACCCCCSSATHDPHNAHHGGWSFPYRYMKKNDGGRHLVTMFQDLNKVMVRDPWPLPNIVDFKY